MPGHTFKRQLTLSLFVPLLSMVALSGVLLWGIVVQISTTNWVEHSDAVLLRIKDTQMAMRDMMLATRNYLISPAPENRRDFTDRRVIFTQSLADLGSIVIDNPEQETRVLEISDLKGDWAHTLEMLLSARDRGSIDPDILAQSRSQARDIEQKLQIFANDEFALRNQRKARSRGQNEIVVAAAMVLSIFVGIFLTYWGWRQIRDAGSQFAAALKRADEGARLKDNFIATVSHELRNPLNSIMLWCHAVLADDQLSAKARRGLLGIDRAAKTQAQLIDDLLDVSRMETGRLRLDVQATDLAEVVRTAVEGLRIAAQTKSIELKAIIDPKVGLIAGDPNRLQQVMWNLVSNAVKFTPVGGKIQVRLERINSHVEIIVADNGKGIEPSALPHVFERFWQAADPEHRESGFGLGLAIVRQLVALHGGTVTAHSEGRGKGTTFTVRLPLPVAAAPALNEPRRHPTVAPSTASVGAAARLDGFSIMVVDDDADACNALKDLLGGLGATVASATSVDAALAMMTEVSPDVVVSDIGMPVRDGLSFARELREREQRCAGSRHLPLLALTAYGRVDDRIQILQAGFDNHVVKPVELAELSAIIIGLALAHAAAPSTKSMTVATDG